ncbi:aspartate 1-decarboxylase autocleavage activator PanM [Motilimonas cestriensis]|uniref:Aspartate 1-decarboxylase autocleavage activator PanM n=1 Tax=Motilimonas cestriensis TaxID=2742685 RepID=A0ABS8W8P7_9GAMM|nr:aspartate 1-decarboxylase autocleavage activator PanM [Motilimonas cestriensis]MCE2594737.1 aspartate 1-decarboxylase autocleavage activator PanM [Motilimonas cestriensis]
MRLSVFHPQQVEPQLLIDLKKIYASAWPELQLTDLALNSLIAQKSPSLYVAMFNERHIAAALLSIEGNTANLSQFTVRDLTRRRGVGKYLLTQLELIAKAQGATTIATTLNEQEQPFSGFLVAMGYQEQHGKWCKTL